MNTVTVSLNDKTLMVKGMIEFGNVLNACQQGVQLILGLKQVTVDFKGLEGSDSSGLALLTAWVRTAKAQNKTIHFTNIPGFMHDIIRVCGLDGVLPIIWEN